MANPDSTELKLSPALKETVNTALARGRMMSVAYVSPEGRPELSFRGSVQALSDTQLAIWVRDPAGGIIKAVTSGHPHIALLYGELGPESKAFVTFRGRGRVELVRAAAPQGVRRLPRSRAQSGQGPQRSRPHHRPGPGRRHVRRQRPQDARRLSVASKSALRLRQCRSAAAAS